MDWSKVNYMGSVLFACAAALVIRNDLAALACMFAWAGAYVGSLATGDSALNGTPGVVAAAYIFTAAAIVAMVAAWLAFI